jgi:dihydroneopterin aldolase
VTQFLASVRSAAEAATALAGGADIIDAKEPASGALGRVAPAALAAILQEVGGRRPVSATIGDMILAPAPVRRAVEEMAASGAQIVKIGLFEGDLPATLSALAPLAASGLRMVAVAFADRRPDLTSLVMLCGGAGFYGLMLDTSDKGAGPLTAHCRPAELAAFVGAARRARLFTGLAGSLRRADVPILAPLGADYLGFRSALTAGRRNAALDERAVRAVRVAIDQASRDPSSIATATAGAIADAAAPSAGVAISTISSKLR